MGESGRKYGGFTLLELLVAITSSTVKYPTTNQCGPDPYRQSSA